MSAMKKSMPKVNRELSQTPDLYSTLHKSFMITQDLTNEANDFISKLDLNQKLNSTFWSSKKREDWFSYKNYKLGNKYHLVKAYNSKLKSFEVVPNECPSKNQHIPTVCFSKISQRNIQSLCLRKSFKQRKSKTNHKHKRELHYKSTI